MIGGQVELGKENVSYLRKNISLEQFDDCDLEHHLLKIVKNDNMRSYSMATKHSWEKFIKCLKKINGGQ